MNVPVEPTGNWNRGARAERRRRKTSRLKAADDEQTEGGGVRVENGHTDTGHGFVFRRDSDVD